MLSCICQFCVLRSFSPKDSAAFCRAERRVSTFCRCASISLFSTVFRAESACTELSFLSNCEDTSFISEPRTLKDWLISASAFLNSFSPSTPIRSPKSSAMQPHPLPLNAVWYHIINGQLPLRLRKAHELLMALPKVHKQAKRRQPRFIHGKVELCDAVI